MTMTMTSFSNRALTSGRISLFAQKGIRRSSSRGIFKVQKTIQSKAFILRNVGDLDRNHLEEEGNTTEGKEDAIPRVLRLNGAKSVVGRVSSSAVNLAVGVATVAVLALRSRRESERILEALSEKRREQMPANYI